MTGRRRGTKFTPVHEETMSTRAQNSTRLGVDMLNLSGRADRGQNF
jgi:hypothetical protein